MKLRSGLKGMREIVDGLLTKWPGVSSNHIPEQTDQKVEMQAATSIQARENNVYMKVWRYRHRIEHYGSAGGHRKVLD